MNPDTHNSEEIGELSTDEFPTDVQGDTEADMQQVIGLYGAEASQEMTLVPAVTPTATVTEPQSAPVIAVPSPSETEAEDETDAEDLEDEFFMDEETYFGDKYRKGYTAQVKIGPATFFIVEAPPEIIALYNKENTAVEKEFKSIDQASKRITKESKESRTALTDEQLEALEARGKALEERVEKATARQVAINTRVIEATVRDWKNPRWPVKRPCNTASRAKLSPSRKAELVDLILQKTKTGRSASDRFLVS